ncbi:hypothetical protein [uncultured Shimia sp.]|uniref:hypothetical protein n=1 Tax=uncultured Shimia sp. TaxID=573152 RepID=UPI0026323498|nr:hypothetical protein [uncultured Shimia sp.]
MEQVCLLRPDEHVCLNPERVVQLKRQLGNDAARDVLSRAMEALALRLEQVQNCYTSEHQLDMRKYTRSLLAIADQIGLDTLTMAEDDVVTCIDSGDLVALSATFTRLMRSGKTSLSEIWELQGTRR